MKNCIVVVVACFFFALATQVVAQDCETGQCKPERPVVKWVKKLKQSPRVNFEFKLKCETKRNWKSLRPCNWFKRWGCK